MDISELETVDAHEAGAEVRIKDIDGLDTDFYITVMGVDSREYQKQLIQIRNKVYRAVAAGEEPDEDDDGSEGLAAITLDWKGLTREGEDVPFSREEAQALYAKAPRVRQQLENFIGNARNFTSG